MFENIKPSEQIHTVALPIEIARTLDDVYFYNDIKDTGIIIEGSHGAYRCLHDKHIREMYEPIQKQWYTEFKRRYPDFELLTADDYLRERNFDDSFFSVCFETNLSDEDIWRLVDSVVNNSATDDQILIAKEKAEKARIENEKFVRENMGKNNDIYVSVNSKR